VCGSPDKKLCVCVNCLDFSSEMENSKRTGSRTVGEDGNGKQQASQAKRREGKEK